jgi:hypothetical protein
MAKVKSGKSCSRQRSRKLGDNHKYCYQHQSSQTGGQASEPSQINLQLDNGDYWKIGRKMWKKDYGTKDRVVLPLTRTYTIYVPFPSDMGVESVTLMGPVTIKRLFDTVSNFYLEHGGVGKNLLNTIGADSIVSIVRTGAGTYQVEMK